MVEPAQLALALPFDVALGRDDLIIHDGNREAVAWLGRWPDWPGGILALAGPSASGKTHLATIWALDHGAVSAHPRSLTVADIPDLAGGAVVIEGADAIADQDALFHLINAVREAGGTLLVTASSPPARWPVVLPDLRSRLAALPVARLGLPDEAVLGALIAKHLADRQLALESGLIAWIVSHIDRTPAAARAVAEALDRESLSAGRRLSAPLVRRVVGALAEAP